MKRAGHPLALVVRLVAALGVTLLLGAISAPSPGRRCSRTKAGALDHPNVHRDAVDRLGHDARDHSTPRRRRGRRPPGGGRPAAGRFNELRKLAAARIAAENPGHTLDATALVHEAYLRLIGDQQFDGRGHFFAGLTLGDAAEAMGIPRRTADRHWSFARAWLADALAGG